MHDDPQGEAQPEQVVAGSEKGGRTNSREPAASDRGGVKRTLSERVGKRLLNLVASRPGEVEGAAEGRAQPHVLRVQQPRRQLRAHLEGVGVRARVVARAGEPDGSTGLRGRAHTREEAAAARGAAECGGSLRGELQRGLKPDLDRAALGGEGVMGSLLREVGQSVGARSKLAGSF